MQRLLHRLHQPRRVLILYILLVLMAAMLLFLRNPAPWLREDLWGEDGRDYIAGIINDGFWKALYLNFLHKGYVQFFKFFVASLCLGINRILFEDEIVFLPRVIAITSYLIYAAVFCLPILLFHSRISVKYLIAIAIASCFVDVGVLDNFLIAGRILNVGFLSIYLCFLLVIYRILFLEKLKNSILCWIDLIIFLCVLTQLTNVLLLALVYLNFLGSKAIDLLNKNQPLTDSAKQSKGLSVSLIAIGMGTIAYFLSILLHGLVTESYATVYGSMGNEKYSHQFYFGKFWFNQIVAPTYEDFSDKSALLALTALILFVLLIREKVVLYCLYAITAVSAITLYWRPGLLIVMKYGESLKATVYTMPSNLIFIFMSFVILAALMRKFNNFSFGIFKLDNVLLTSLLCLYLATGLHTLSSAEFIPTISLRQGLCLADIAGSHPEITLVKVPTNPGEMDMLLPRTLVKCRSSRV